MSALLEKLSTLKIIPVIAIKNADDAVALGRAIAGVVTVLDPACVVIGGGVAAAGDEWWTPLRAACRGEVVPVLNKMDLSSRRHWPVFATVFRRQPSVR